MLVEPGVVEQRYRAVLEVLEDGDWMAIMVAAMAYRVSQGCEDEQFVTL